MTNHSCKFAYSCLRRKCVLTFFPEQIECLNFSVRFCLVIPY